MVFTTYAAAAFVTYVLLSPLYTAELRKPWSNARPWTFTSCIPSASMTFALSLVKGADWALYMWIDENVGAFIAALVCPTIFFGFQEYVDRKIKGQDAALNASLWNRSFLSVGTMLDGWIHLSLFRLLRYYVEHASYAPLRIGGCNVIAHSVALFSTYPFTSVRRQNKRWWEGFALYYVRSSLASFLISFIVEFHFL